MHPSAQKRSPVRSGYSAAGRLFDSWPIHRSFSFGPSPWPDTVPDADFCPAFRMPLGRLSRRSDTEQISWGKLSRLPCTIAESKLRTLMDTDLRLLCPLVRHCRLISGFCPSSRTFDPCFLQPPPRGGSPCIITRSSPPSGWPEDFHL